MSASGSSVLEWLQLQNTQPHAIFYSSLRAVIASTFLALHLNIPPPFREVRDTDSPLARLWYCEATSQARRWVCWGIAVVIAPELLVSIAFGDWRAARAIRRVLKEYNATDPKIKTRLQALKKWDLARISFANMGGIKFEMNKGGESIPTSAPFWGDGHYDDEYHIWKLWLRARTTEFAGAIVKNALSSAEVVVKRIQTSLSRMTHQVLATLTRLWQRPILPADITSHDLSRSSVPAEIELSVLDLSAGAHNSTEADCGAEPEFELQNLLRDLDANSLQMPLSSEDNIDESAGPSHRLPYNLDSSPMTLSVAREQQNQIVLHLNAIQIALGCVLGVVDRIPSLDMSEITQQGPSRTLKVVAVIQLAWFGLGAIISLSANQPISHLEVAASTYLLCALVSYALFWSKPQGVTRPIIHKVEVSQSTRPITDQDLNKLRKFSGSPFLTRNFVPPFGMDGYSRNPMNPIPNGTSLTIFSGLGTGIVLFDDDFAGTIAGTIFSMLYALGWDRPFPSDWEQVAWFTASAVITGSLIPYSAANALCTVAYSDLAKSGNPRTHVVHSIVLASLLALYVACRVYMLVEMFRFFFSHEEMN